MISNQAEEKTSEEGRYIGMILSGTPAPVFSLPTFAEGSRSGSLTLTRVNQSAHSPPCISGFFVAPGRRERGASARKACDKLNPVSRLAECTLQARQIEIQPPQVEMGLDHVTAISCNSKEEEGSRQRGGE